MSRKEILQLIQDAKISSEEGMRLLKGLKEKKTDHDEQKKTFYYQEWKKDENVYKAFTPKEDECIILFAPNRSMYHMLLQSSEFRGIHVVLVMSGQNYTKIEHGIYEINQADETDYQKLIQEIKGNNDPHITIIHCWSGITEGLKEDRIADDLECGVYSVSYIYKACFENKAYNGIRFLFCYQSDQPQYAAVSGLLKTIEQEDKNYQCTSLQWGDHGDEEKFQSIRTELGAPKEKCVRYEKGVRYRNSFKEYQPPIGDVKQAVKQQGTYLITGGMGSIGLIFADYFARNYNAKLILSGRSELDKERMSILHNLREHGAEVEYIKAVTSKKQEAEALVEQAITRFGKIDGVIHAAGVMSDSLLLNKTKQEFENVIASKVYGSIYLMGALKTCELDFVAFFSSVSAAMGNAGQSDYAFANSFLNEYANYLSAEEDTCRYVSIGWSLWENGGMKSTKTNIAAMKQAIGIEPIQNDAGIKAFLESIYAKPSCLYPLTGDLEMIRKAMAEPIHTEEETVTEKKEIYQSKADISAEAEKYLKKIFSKHLKLHVSKISSTEPLDSYGVDSVMIMELTNDLEREFGELSKTLFFEYQTIAELTQYFIENHYEDIYIKAGVERKVMKKVTPERKETVAEVKTPQKQQSIPEEDIAIIGLDGRFPLAKDLDQFWENLKIGKDCITEIPTDRWDYREYYDTDKNKRGKSYSKWGGFLDDVDKFDPLFFHISPVEAQIMDPQERLFLETAWHTVENAGYSKKRLNAKKVGIFVGVMYGHYQLFGVEETMKGNGMALSSSYASIANRVSYFFNFHGPSMALDTMCSSSLTAIHLACDSIRKGESEMALAGGVNVSIHPNKYLMLSGGKFTSSNGKCMSFGEGGDGYVPGEGVGAVLLKSLSKAKEDGDRIYAVIKASALNHGGKTNGYTVPNPNAQAEIIAETLNQSGIHPRTISYLEAHGTGTSLGDPIEITGLSKAFKQHTNNRQYCSIGSVKSNIGHCESAAGIAGIAKVLLQMKHKKLLPSIHSETLNSNINFEESPFYVQHEYADWAQPVINENGEIKTYPRRAGVSSFGAGGANAHIILEEYEQKQENDNYIEDEPHLIVLSAKNEERLHEHINALHDYITEHTEQKIIHTVDEKSLMRAVDKDLIQALAQTISIHEEEIGVEDAISDFISDITDLSVFAAKISESYALEIKISDVSTAISIHVLANQLFREQRQAVLNKYPNCTKEERLETGSSIHLQDIAYTLQKGREDMEERVVFQSENIGELKSKLKDYLNGNREMEGFYNGNILQNKEKAELFQNGRAGEEYIRIVIQEKDIEKIAQLWICGVEIDWDLYYDCEPHQIISLPGYPFERERYWVPEGDSNEVQVQYNEETNALHPLLTKNTSSLNKQKFTTPLHGDSLYVKAIKLDDKKILTVSECMEMFLSASELSGLESIGGLRDIYWLRPVTIGKHDRELEVSIRKIDGQVECELRILNAFGEGEVIARASLLTDNTESHLDSIDLSAKKELLGANQGAFVYEQLEKGGLTIGSDARQIQEYYASDDKALALIQLKEESGKGSDKFLLHPLVMEAAIQTAQSILRKELGYVCEIESIEILDIPKEMVFAYAEIDENNKNSASLSLCDTNGTVLVKMTSVKTASVSRDYKEVNTDREISCFMEKTWIEAANNHKKSQDLQGKTVILLNQERKAFAKQCVEEAILVIHTPDTYEKDASDEYRIDLESEAYGTKLANELLLEGEIKQILDLTDIEVVYQSSSMKYGKVSLLQEILKRQNKIQTKILHVTDHLIHLQGKSTTLSGADFAGIVRMLGSEYKKSWSKTLDLDMSSYEEHALADIIAKELASDHKEAEICYRKNRRYKPIMNEVKSGTRRQKKYIETEGVYVITGGIRGIGAEIAKHIVKKGAKRLVLMGLQELPKREQWDSLLKEDSVRPEIKQRIQLVKHLEDKGATVSVYCGVLTDEKALSEYFDDIRENYGKINGVIHCAGVSINTQPAFINKPHADIQRVYEPKKEALHTLHRVFAQDKLKFFILFSSVSALMPILGAGMSDYAGANAYMDYFAANQHDRGNTHYKSIQWPKWKEVGMDGTISPAYKMLGLDAVKTAKGLEMLDTIVGLNQPTIAPLIIDEEFNKEQLLEAELDKKTSLKPTETAKEYKTVRKQENVQTKTMMKLKELFSEELNIKQEKLDENTPFADFGVDSVLLGGLVNKIETWSGEKVDPGVFLENPTLKQLGSYLDESVFQVTGDEKTESVRQVVATTKETNMESYLVFEDAHTRKIVSRDEWSEQPDGKIFEKSRTKKIAVIGMECHFPQARNKDEYWDNLKNGKDNIIEIPPSRWKKEELYSAKGEEGKSISKWGGFIEGIEEFDPLYFGISEDEAPHIDPLIRQFLEVSTQTLRDAGYEKKELWNKKVGVFVGSRVGSYGMRIEKPKKSSVTGIGQNFIAAHVSHVNNFKGPNVVVDSACSSSLVSIHLACQSIAAGESEMALAGGVDVLLDASSYILLSQGKALSPDGRCHTFDEKANGFVPGEGCGAVLLKDLDSAMRDGDKIYAVIEASAVNNDGNTMGITTPNPEAQMDVIQEALNKGRIDPKTISYIEAHGTGTMIGDPIELRALTKIFRQSTEEKQFCKVGSVKSNMGHLLSAAGIASFMKVALSIWHEQLPPTLHCETPNPRFDFQNSPFIPNTELNMWEKRYGVRRAGISSFGFGGTNAHVILSGMNAAKENYKNTRQSLPPVEFHKQRYWLLQRNFQDISDGTVELAIQEESGTHLLEIVDET